MPEQLNSESPMDPEASVPEASGPQTPNSEALSFEEAFRRLGEMVDSLESGGRPLAEATVLYQQGMGLVRRCNQLLNEAQLKITQLRGDDEDPAMAGDGADWEEEIFEEP